MSSVAETFPLAGVWYIQAEPQPEKYIKRRQLPRLSHDGATATHQELALAEVSTVGGNPYGVDNNNDDNNLTTGAEAAPIPAPNYQTKYGVEN